METTNRGREGEVSDVGLFQMMACMDSQAPCAENRAGPQAQTQNAFEWKYESTTDNIAAANCNSEGNSIIRIEDVSAFRERIVRSEG